MSKLPLNLRQRLEIAANQTLRSLIFHVDEGNGKFDPDNKLYRFIVDNGTRLSIEDILKGLEIIGFPIHGFHQDKNGFVRSNLCDIMMYAKFTDFCKKILGNIDVFTEYEEISHFGHHLHQIKIKNCGDYYPLIDRIFPLLDHVKKNNLIEFFDTGDNNGDTPFMLFIKEFSDIEIIDKFASIGCNIHHINNDGDNILHLLAKKYTRKYGGKYDDIKFLVSLGVDPLLPNYEEVTAYGLLPESKREEIIQIMEKNEKFTYYTPFPETTKDEVVPLKQTHVTSVNPYDLLMDSKNIRNSFDMKEYLEEELGIYNLEDLEICTKELHHDIQSYLKTVPGLRYASCYPQYFS